MQNQANAARAKVESVTDKHKETRMKRLAEEIGELQLKVDELKKHIDYDFTKEQNKHNKALADFITDRKKLAKIAVQRIIDESDAKRKLINANRDAEIKKAEEQRDTEKQQASTSCDEDIKQVIAQCEAACKEFSAEIEQAQQQIAQKESEMAQLDLDTVEEIEAKRGCDVCLFNISNARDQMARTFE
jgi:chromosome segregation ATPase